MQKAHDSSYNDYWKNKPNITTPIVQDQLNRIETTIDTIDDRVVTFDTTKANQVDYLTTIVGVNLNDQTGVLTFTRANGTTIVFDTDLEKIATNFDYDDDPTSPHYQNLIITLDDGTVKYVDMSALITEYEFTDSAIIHFTITNGDVSADVINGSITAEKLQPNFLADCVSAKEGAETAETNAETAETNALAHQYTAEAWAKGTKNNIPVTPIDAQYHDNAYYWAQQARSIVGDKVDSFNGRTGTVVAQDGDYESGMIVPETGAISGQVPVVRNVGTGQDVKLRYVNEDLDIGLKPHIIVISETGSTVTLTKGTKVIYANETSPEHFEADVTEFGTWVIDSVLSGDDAQVSLVVDAVKIYTVDDSHWHADITVTYPTGGTCSCSKSGTTTLYATGSPYTFTVHESGTYTITATANGETYTDNVEVTTSGQTESLTIPEGSTITPTDSVATLLSCAGIHDTSITSVSDLLADTTTLLAVINSNNAIDYLVRSKSLAKSDALVPTMTSATTPSGEAFYDFINYTSDMPVYYAFDKNTSTRVMSNGGSTQRTCHIGYIFPEATVVGKFMVRLYVDPNNSRILPVASVKLQCSTDGESWEDISTTKNPQTVGTEQIFDVDNIPTRCRYYRLECVDGQSPYNSLYYTCFAEIQFYTEDGITQDSTAMSYIGLNNYAANTLLADSDWLNAIAKSTYIESVMNVKVPTMTSNTTPSGTASASAVYSADYPAWKAFDKNTGSNSVWASPANPSFPQWLSYAFESAKKIFVAKIRPTAHRLKGFEIRGSNDSFSTYDVLIDTTYTEAETEQKFMLNNSNNYLEYRIYVKSSYQSTFSVEIAEFQLYGREDV